MGAPAARAAALLREAELVPLIVRPDADSVLAAALLALALHRAKIPWHVRFAPTAAAEAFAELPAEAPGQPLLLVGLGGRDAEELPVGQAAVIADGRLPRLQPPGDALLLEDPLPGATTATLALELARALDPRASPLLALAGLDAAGPSEGSDSARTRLLGEAGPQGGREGAVPALGAGPAIEAIAACVDPFLPGLSGRARAAKKFLDGLGLSSSIPIDEMTPAAQERLATALTLHLLAGGAPGPAPRVLLAPDAYAAVPGGSARGLARLCGAACAASRPGLALALALGDPRGEREAVALVEARHQRLLQALVKLEGDGQATGPLRADPDLAADLAWGAALSLRGGEPVAAVAGGDLHVAAPLSEPRFLAQAAWESARAAGGLGSSLGHRAVLQVPSARVPEAWDHFRRALGVLA